MRHILLGIVGLSGGMIIASALVAFLIGLNIIPRYAGITHTAKHVMLYENCVIAGAIWGNILTVYPVTLPPGGWVPYVVGLFGGIFIGSWIIALTEVLDMIPIMSRMAGLKSGFAAIIILTALGKTIFSLIFFYNGW